MKIIYLLFSLSGAAGLIYEIVWGRLLVLIFGSTTNSIVAVIAAFLGGLAIGSLIFGKIADDLSPKKLIRAYSNLELGVGITAALTLILMPLVKNIYGVFSDGSQTNLIILSIKFFASIFILAIPTTLMGATLPILIKFLESQKTQLTKSVSLLYSANTLGAVVGVLLSAFVLIELFGLKNTILTAAVINLLIAFLARFIKVENPKKDKNNSKSPFSKLLTPKNIIVISAFSLSGFISVSYEVLWTRILTPSVGTFIYAFASILAIYLFGIAAGSFIYQKFSQVVRGKSIRFAVCELAIGFFALGSVYLTSGQVEIGTNLMILLAILPATIFMGLSFPAVVSLTANHHSGKIVGLLYFANTIGSIFGAFLVSFFFLPKIGSSQSVILLSIFNFAIAAIFIFFEKYIKFSKRVIASIIVLMLILFTGWLFTFKRHSLYENTTQWHINWAKENNIDFIFKEDEVASTFGYHNQKNNDQNLFIDGVPTTGRVGETKLMAHIPILLHNDPQDVLVIAFGMGTTFRSSLSYDINTDVVELVPSVPKMMMLFQKDSGEILKNKKGRIIINDGRNYIFLTHKKYDIVTIDPPPPFNAAGTTVLYSENFYEDVAKKLKPGGIVSQWMWFGSREDDIAMATKSFTNVFPYILVFQNPSGNGGIFLEGSFSPFVLNKVAYQKKLTKEKPNKDLKEIYENFELSDVLNLAIGDRESILNVIGSYQPVTDDKPRTEYFLLRHLFKNAQDLVGLHGAFFINDIKSNSKPILTPSDIIDVGR